MSVHGSPVIQFPAHELADLKARLAAGHTISSAHPQGKHKAGDILMSGLGMLRVLSVKQVAPHELTAHSGATKAHVAGGQADMLELKKLGGVKAAGELGRVLHEMDEADDKKIRAAGKETQEEYVNRVDPYKPKQKKTATAVEVLEQRKIALGLSSLAYPLLGAGLTGGLAAGAEHMGVFGHPDAGPVTHFADETPAPAGGPAATPAAEPAHVPAAPAAAQTFPHNLTGFDPATSQHSADIINQYAARDDRLKAMIVDQMAQHPGHDWRAADQATLDPMVKAQAPWYVPNPVEKFHTATGPMFQAFEAANPAEEQNALRIMQLHRAGIR